MNIIIYSYYRMLKQRVFPMMLSYEYANDTSYLKHDSVLPTILAIKPLVYLLLV